jgi:hypothetical protein
MLKSVNLLSLWPLSNDPANGYYYGIKSFRGHSFHGLLYNYGIYCFIYFLKITLSVNICDFNAVTFL